MEREKKQRLEDISEKALVGRLSLKKLEKIK